MGDVWPIDERDGLGMKTVDESLIKDWSSVGGGVPEF